MAAITQSTQSVPVIDINELQKSTDEVREAHRHVSEFMIPNRYAELIGELEKAASLLPRNYKEKIVDPLIKDINNRSDFGRFSLTFSKIECDVIQAILMYTEECTYTPKSASLSDRSILSCTSHSYCKMTRAAQEMICDLHKGLLFYERKKVATPHVEEIAPFLGWASQPTRAFIKMHLNAPIALMPIVYRRNGLFAWTALAHKVSGNALLYTKKGLLAELKKVVRLNIKQQLAVVQTPDGKISHSKHLAKYWSSRIDEAASDVLGFLHLGPTAAIGLIGYLRALTPNGKLRGLGPEEVPRIADILRGLLAAEVVDRLSFSNRHEWAMILSNEVLKDYPLQQTTSSSSGAEYDLISIEGNPIPYQSIRQSAAIVADTIMNSPLKFFKRAGDQHRLSLAEIRSWSDEDENHVDAIRPSFMLIFRDSKICHGSPPSDYFAEHVIAAATMEALRPRARNFFILDRQIQLLASMNRFNPSSSAPSQIEVESSSS